MGTSFLRHAGQGNSTLVTAAICTDMNAARPARSTSCDARAASSQLLSIMPSSTSACGTPKKLTYTTCPAATPAPPPDFPPPSSPPPPPLSPPPKGKSSLSAGALAGIFIGSVIGIILLCVVIALVHKKNLAVYSLEDKKAGAA